MGAIEGYQCDKCGIRRTTPTAYSRVQSRPLPTEGWFVTAAPDIHNTDEWLWMCSPRCVRDFMEALICGDGCDA